MTANLCAWCGVAPATEADGECAACSRLPGHELATGWHPNAAVLEWLDSVHLALAIANHDWNGYCGNCDRSYAEEVAKPVGAFWQVWACPHCGDEKGSQLEIADAWWPVQQYLLQGSEYDEGVGLVLPAYEE